MKRSICLLLILVATIFAAEAQRHYVPHIHVGIHGGMSLSRISFYPSVKESYLNGFQGGISFRYAEERHVGLLAELNIEQRGWKENYEDAPFSYHHRLTYIQLPVMTHIFFGSRTVKGFFNLGPQIGLLVGDNISSNFDYSSPTKVEGFPYENRQTEQLSMDISNRFDYGITAGAGLEIVIARRNSITLEGRYYYGLGNIFPSSKKDVFSASRGSSIVITLGYLFRLK